MGAVNLWNYQKLSLQIITFLLFFVIINWGFITCILTNRTYQQNNQSYLKKKKQKKKILNQICRRKRLPEKLKGNEKVSVIHIFALFFFLYLLVCTWPLNFVFVHSQLISHLKSILFITSEFGTTENIYIHFPFMLCLLCGWMMSKLNFFVFFVRNLRSDRATKRIAWYFSKRRSKSVCRCRPQSQAIVADGHHVQRCSSIVVGHTCSYTRSAEDFAIRCT